MEVEACPELVMSPVDGKGGNMVEPYIKELVENEGCMGVVHEDGEIEGEVEEVGLVDEGVFSMVLHD